MKMNGFGKATQEMVNAFEQHIGFSLPEDYRKFLLEYNGGTPLVKYAAFTIEELNEDIPLDVLLGLGINNLDLQKRNDDYMDDLLPHCVIIGDDPGSGMIVLIDDPEMKGVYYWDHSFNFEQSNEDDNIYKIADSFQEFVDGLKNP